MRFLPRAALAAALLVPALLSPVGAFAQVAPIAGDWYGTLEAGGKKVPIIFHIKADGTATLDSPTQNTLGLQASAVSIGGKVRLALAAAPIAFEGTAAADGKTLEGNWTQGSASLPLTLGRTPPAPVVAQNRPQTPRPPFPYRAEEVSYVNPASGLKLAGTLTLPQGKGPFPAVVLITGSGQQDRDGTIFGHKPFLLIADALTRKGVAVLRVDDRGIGGSQAGELEKATSSAFATDVGAGVTFLRGRQDIDPARIGLIGHSEGGAIAPMAAAHDPRIAFLVLMAAPGVDGLELLLSQNRALAQASGLPADRTETALKVKAAWFEAARDAQNDDDARARLVAVLDRQGVPANAPQRAQVLDLAKPWWREALNSHPAETLAKIKVPVLAIGGGKDLQVPAAANLAAIKAALAADKDVTTTELPGLNHLFQTADTGLPGEYAKIEETLAPAALGLIVDWTVAHAVKTK